MLVTDHGVIIRFGVETVSQTGRSALGVHLIKMDNGTHVATIAKVEKKVMKIVKTILHQMKIQLKKQLRKKTK